MRPRALLLAGLAATALAAGPASAGACAGRPTFVGAHAVVCVAEDGCVVSVRSETGVPGGPPVCVPGGCVVDTPMHDVCVATASCAVLYRPSMPPSVCIV